MHLKNFLKNWIKANNVFLMLKQGNSMQKLTVSQSNITVRRRSVPFKCFTDGKKYNNKYPHLAFELCNIFGIKTSFASDNYFFLLVDLHCTSVKKKKNSFASSQKQLSYWIFRMIFEFFCWSLALLPVLAYILKIHVLMFYANSTNSHDIILFSSSILINFLLFAVVCTFSWKVFFQNQDEFKGILK